MILPVWLTHDDDTTTTKLVYAILDNQSDTSFILKKTAIELNLPSVEVELMLSTMLAENQRIKSDRIQGLSVRGLNNSERIKLPTVYTREIIPANQEHIPTPEMTRRWPHLSRLFSKIPPLQDAEVALLLGTDVSRVLEPLEVIPSSSGGPFGQRTVLGWGIVGVIDERAMIDEIGYSHRIISQSSTGNHIQPQTKIVMRTSVKEVMPETILKILQADFHESQEDTLTKTSQDDKQFLQIMESGIKKIDGRYQMPLPFRDKVPQVASNKALALKRLSHLKRKLQANSTFKKHYDTFMEDLLSKGYAERAQPIQSKTQPVSYIPHHGVYNINKPGKVRVVFDCSAGSPSLNDCLLPGPDLTNSLIGVLCRFRLAPIAFLCDVEKMFYQFRVNEECRDYLRFFWWVDGNLDTEPAEFRMTVHLFGASSSPGCSNYGLKQTATDNKSKYGEEAADFLQSNFYVDDGLKSCETIEEAQHLVKASVDMCAEGGLRLHKFVANDKQVLDVIPEQDRAKVPAQHDLMSKTLPLERALGIQWSIESDTFRYKIVIRDRPSTRRGILSTVSSIYDPLGFLAPFILLGKQLLQILCRDGYDWDSKVPEDIQDKWFVWKSEALKLDQLHIERCVKPKDFGRVVKSELHHFTDASSLTGYGTCSYLRQTNEEGQVYTSLVMGKSRVVPLKKITVPRLELTAAVVAVNIGTFLIRELKLESPQVYYWTDSKVVLGYVKNTTKRFHVFVANRIEHIRNHTNPEQWKHIKGTENPADIASRGISAEKLAQSRLWFHGPDFLSYPTSIQDSEEEISVDEDDPEINKRHVLSTCTTQNVTPLVERFKRISSWTRLRRVIALCLLYKQKLLARVRSSDDTHQGAEITVNLLKEADREIIKAAQQHAFQKEFNDLDKGFNVRKNSSIYKLDPFCDANRLLRVRGRLSRSTLSYDERHPLILPKTSYVTQLLVRHFHDKCYHQGKGITLNTIRSNGFWIVGITSLVGKTIRECVICRKVRSPPQVQKMADLPSDRCEESTPFSYVAVDFFGPFYIKEGRKTLKRYGCLFTCLSSRAVHIEVANSLSTDSFVNALRRLMSIRGPIRLLRCDRGTNFVGANRELRESIESINDPNLKTFLQNNNCEFEFKFNPPSASHFGGVYERMIRSTRNVLDILLEQHSSQLDDESLRTFMFEASAIINSRPLTYDTVNDPLSLQPLSPNNILMLKSQVVLPPPGQFVKEDIFLRKRWKRVQYLLDQFWSRWKREYLSNLQQRNKWNRVKRNMAVGDVAILKDPDLPRNEWKLCQVIEVMPSKDDLVRSVKIRLANPSLNKHGRPTSKPIELERPVHKLVLLVEGDSPSRSQS